MSMNSQESRVYDLKAKEYIYGKGKGGRRQEELVDYKIAFMRSIILQGVAGSGWYMLRLALPRPF